MNSLYPIVLGVIVLVLLSVSLSRLRGTQTKADYLVAGRSLPAIVLVFTLLSSWIGSGSLLGGAENVKPPRLPKDDPPPTRATASPGASDTASASAAARGRRKRVIRVHSVGGQII